VGSVTGAPGDTYTRVGGTSSRIYQHRGTSANNTDWVELGGGGGGPPNIGFYAYRATPQSIPNNALTTLGFTATRDDAGGNFTTGVVDSYFTCPTAGRYVFDASIRLDTVFEGYCYLVIESSTHGTVSVGGYNIENLDIGRPNITAVLYCDASEVIRARAYHDTGVAASLGLNHFAGAQIVEV
jgi:hypothetical protein